MVDFPERDCLICKVIYSARTTRQKVCTKCHMRYRAILIKQWKEKNKEQIKKESKAYYKKMQNKILQKAKQRRKTDLDFVIKTNTRVKAWLKTPNGIASRRTYQNKAEIKEKNAMRKWARLHAKELIERDKSCVKCGNFDCIIEFHHLEYKNSLTAIISVCKPCHLRLHEKIPIQERIKGMIN